MPRSTVKTRALAEALAPEALFGLIAEEPGAVWLDSSLSNTSCGRCSLIARRPCAIYQYDNGRISITVDGIMTGSSGTLVDFLNRIETAVLKDNLVAAGYVSYEACLRFADISGVSRESDQPGALFFLYESVLWLDHTTGIAHLSNPEINPFEQMQSDPSSLHRKPIARSVPVHSNVSSEDYAGRIRRIKDHISAGDIYQADFTCSFDIRSSSKPFDIYRELRRLNPAPYSAYLNCGDFQILSSSPEQMFTRRGARIETSPIKGTIARGKNESEDIANTRVLLASEKDRAELLMIVDLVRNDLGKIARYGSVKVESLFNPELYSSVIHLVSRITAEIPADLPFGELCRALLPGGSITGAPKRRAIQILQELETVPRFVYTGNIGYITPDVTTLNIAIRTIIHENGRYRVHSGGGIVADSDVNAEYQEMLLKAKNLFEALSAHYE